MRVLCLDIEGGYGGSSRSLYESIKAITHEDAVDVEVWCKRKGPIQEKYKALGIKVCVEPYMPKITSLAKLSRNAVQYIQWGLELAKARSFLDHLIKVERDFDVIHLNHESLHHLAKWLKQNMHLPIVMHIRTQPPPGFFARQQAARIAAYVDDCIYISENEKQHWQSLCAAMPEGHVIYNIAELPSLETRTINNTGVLKVACISNYSWGRGTDRLVDIALCLKNQECTSVHFIVAGKSSLSNSLPGGLGKIARKGGTLSDFANEQGVGRYFTFLGHVPDPENVMKEVDLLIKPTRENNPWGRDVLEALACGCPVISFGEYDVFVETGKTGFLYKQFSAPEIAKLLQAVAEDSSKLIEYGINGRNRIYRLCSARRQGKKLLSVWSHFLA